MSFAGEVGQELSMAEKLEVQIGEALRAQAHTLALGESCTGGLVGHRITQVPGSSEYFLGGVVAYSYEAKERLLGVHHRTLYEHGAVSRETAIEMAHGARLAFGADYGLSVTGIAGPAGGLPGKPVGLTWIAVSSRQGERSEEHVWQGDRQANKERSAEAALLLLLRVLEDKA
jgi:PncC family amidohydrolase